jgi:catechol 2,3-dioxygenase-like lactoylglutathione lyase family enzyme
MRSHNPTSPALIIVVAALSISGPARAADYHHVHVAAPSPIEAVKWYGDHLDCKPIADRSNAASCAGIEIVFVARATLGGTQGTGVNHIAFSYLDVEAKMRELEDVGVQGTGVRLQRFEDGALVHELPGLFEHGFIFDPWGTRIELVEDADRLGFHHVHLSAVDPAATLAWYASVLGGEPARLKGRTPGLRFAETWLLVSQDEQGRPAPTAGRTLDHLAFVVPDLELAAAEMREQGVSFEQEPLVPAGGRSGAERAFISSPDGVRVAVVETGWAGVESESFAAADATVVREPYAVPRTPWGEPDLQGIWTGDAAHGIPLERPLDELDLEALTPEEAVARRERGTLRSIWGYEREWRDTTLGYVKSLPSTQVAMIVDPPDGRLPPRTPEAARLAEAAASSEPGLPQGPEDLSPYVRCITRGLPGLMMPGVYNNGLQIVQGPGYVAIQKEMIHETRVIPTTPRPHLGASVTQWLGDSRGSWDGDTLVVEATNFNGRAPYQGSSSDMKLVERFTRIAPDVLAYEFTVDDPTVWTRPWTAMFMFVKDDEQYELVEYGCHEGNYAVTNILSGARAAEREAQEAVEQ